MPSRLSSPDDPSDAEDEIASFFAGNPEGLALFRLARGIVGSIGPVTVRTTKSQIAFRRHRAFAWTWTPGRWLSGGVAPLVVSLALSRRDESPRWKEVVEPRPGRWMHHLEVRQPSDLDAEFERWVREAYDAA